MVQNCQKCYSQCIYFCQTLVKDYPEVDICEYAKVIGIDVLDDYLQMTYYAYPINRSIFIPLQYVEAEDVDGFCRVYAEKIRKDGKLMREDEFVEKTYSDLWMKFFKLFEIRMTDPESDLDRARNKLHDLIETATYLLLMTKRKNKEPKNAEILTDKELASLNAVFGTFRSSIGQGKTNSGLKGRRAKRRLHARPKQNS